MKQLLVDNSSWAVRIALLHDKKLKEIFIDHKDGGSIVGDIINGIVKNIMTSRFAFIDIGQEKNAFMNLADNNHSHNNLKQGDYIPVQVRKDATGSKGANVSSILQLKGRLAIIYPSASREIGISSKISDPNERKRLNKIAAKVLPNGYSCILRTQCSGASDEQLDMECHQLIAEHDKIVNTAKNSIAPRTLHKDKFLQSFMFNDLLTDDIDEIILNDEESYAEIRGVCLANTKLWKDDEKLFDAYDVERQIIEALHRNVWLPCGGFITFDYVEACVVIDVNTGKFPGKKNYRETILKVNMEAAQCIADQITLRNLSGMIIIDFIDMTSEADKNTLLTAFGHKLKKGRISADIIDTTRLGLVQLTRRKQREPLHKLLQDICPHCNGTGRMTDNKRR